MNAERCTDAEDFIRSRSIEQSLERWEVVIHDHHPGYISRQSLLSNQRQLASNRTQGGARPPREGSALLQGVVLCGHCGGTMGISYSSSRAAHYRCRSRLD